MNEMHQLQRALAESNQSGKSPLVTEYEDILLEHFGVAHAVAVNSGSAAIEAALVALGARPGRSVLVSAAAPLPTLMPIIATGADLVFVDTETDSPAMNPSDLIHCIDDSVVAAVEVALWGYPLPNDEVRAVLKSNDVPLVEDASHAHEATINGRFIGTLGTVGCFSTHQMKPLSTGEGGFILTDDAALAETVRRYSRIGSLDGSMFGRNYKPSAFTAAIGIARLPSLAERTSKRRIAAENLLLQLPTALQSEVAHVGTPNGYNLVIDIGDADLGLKFHERLATVGIRTDVIRYGYKVGYQHPIATRWARRCLNARPLISSLIQLPTLGDIRDTADRVATAWRHI